MNDNLKNGGAALSSPDELNRVIIETMPIGVHYWNAKYQIISCNDGIVRLFGLSSKQEYIDRFYELSTKYQPDGQLSDELTLKHLQKAFTDGSCNFKWTHVNLQGEVIPVEVNMVRTYYQERPIVIAYTRDLRDLKSMLSEMHKVEADLRLARDVAEESIRLKNEFLAKMSHEMRTPMIVTNNRAEVEYISNSLVELFNMNDMRHALNRPLLELPVSDEMKMMFQEVMASEGYVQKNFELTINEKKYWFMLRSSRMDDNKNARVFEWVDITSLVEAKNEAEIATKAKNDFLAKMSHEIRTPMNAISGMSELILREDIPPLIQEHASSIKQASASLLSIINDILDFSKIESGKLEIVSAEYLLSSLLNDVVSIIRMRIIEAPIRFAVNIDSKLPNRLIGDEVRIRQILLNILGNAVKYTEKGFISIDIDGNIVAGNTVYLVIKISDSGIGIKEEDMSKLFETFVQLDMLKNRGIRGTGLGLSITKSLCLAMGGNISVRSKYGEGSTFTITIPQKIAGYKKLARVQNPDKKRVLLYEPRSTYAQSIARSIDNLGVDCRTITKHSDFYNELQNNSYKFVFITSFLWEASRDIIENSGSTTKWVLLAEFGEDVLPAHNIRKITMPAHAISIANVLNDIADGENYIDSRETTTHFVAPTAKVLIVDDIRTNLKVAEGLMIPYKMQIDTCVSGQEAIRLVKETKYDLIFMDHMMPQMDGVETTNIIRGLEDGSGYYKRVPIVALTANAVDGVKEMFLQNGLSDFLPKPIESLKLNTILEKWIPKEKRKKHKKETHAKNALHELEIEGINVKDGIDMTGGSFDNYIKTLGFFHNDGLKKTTEIREALKENNLKLYTVYVHAIKSAAASIGAAKTSEFAKRLEAAGNKKDIVFIMENNEKFLTKLEALLKNISTATAKYQFRACTEDKVDLGVLKDKLPKLKTAFENMNIREIDNILNELGAKKWDKKISDAIQSIAQNTLMLEYDEAIKIIDELLGTLHVK